MQYTTPGVYVEEISLLPPSVVEVATAIPAFLGYTQTALDENGIEQTGTYVRRISSLKEYTDIFGGSLPTRFNATAYANLADGTTAIGLQPRLFNDTGDLGTLPEFLMYYSMRMFFANGGGACYIVSVGRYGDGTTIPPVARADFESGLAAIKNEDEPTLLVLTDAIKMPADYLLLCQDVLTQCGELKDRFGIFDVEESDADGVTFRNGVGNNNLKYGAAYTPYLQTGQTHTYTETRVNVAGFEEGATNADGLHITYLGDGTPAVSFTTGSGTIAFSVDSGTGALAISGFDVDHAPDDIVNAWAAVAPDAKQGYHLTVAGAGTTDVTSASAVTFAPVSKTMDSLQNDYTQLYNQLKTELAKQRVTLPPSTAMAGIYARVDRERGVWKAPANVSINNVLTPAQKINQADQGRLNVDPTSGKSINVIRAFAGKGVLVWGARTLAGNDNEWRYINVRRLFNLIEESIQKSTGFAVFEPNDATTWLKVKALADAYLYGLWQRGALAGATAETAYFVNVGLGKTMTAQDVLEGKLIVEIGVAAVRPAEFIILRFYHKLQES